MENLKNSGIYTYLAGPIDNINTLDARAWREDITLKLKKYGITTLSPFGKFGGDRLAEVRGCLHRSSVTGNVDVIKSIVANIIIPPDLRMVEECDFITVWVPKLDKEVCGTYGEATLAFYLGKPVYVVTERSLIPLELPKWLVGCSTKIFSSWKSYLSYIKETWANEKSSE